MCWWRCWCFGSHRFCACVGAGAAGSGRFCVGAGAAASGASTGFAVERLWVAVVVAGG